MRMRGLGAAAGAGALLLWAFNAGATGILIVSEDTPVLTNVSVSITAGGPTTYTMAGYVGPLVFTSTAVYDHTTGQTKETLTEANGNTIKSTAVCPDDPWLTNVRCTGGLVRGHGNFTPEVLEKIAQMEAPVSAHLVTETDRGWIRQAYARRLGAQQKLGHIPPRAKSAVLPMPSPTPSRFAASGGAIKTGGLVLPAAAKPAAPSYGATYAPGQPPVIVHVGQAFAVPVVVTNTSGQNWPAGGAFKLSYHWVVNGQVTDGTATPLPAAAGPGASVNVNASVKAPLLNGRWTIRWDMYQDGVGWFSAKGVPASDQPITISP